MTLFRTEIVGLNDRDQIMLKALLATIQSRIGVQWVPHDRTALTVHFVDVESPVGHRYWRGLSDIERRDSSIALAYNTPTHIDAQSRWITKPVRVGALQTVLMEVLNAAERPALRQTEAVVVAQIGPMRPRREALLQRLEAFRGAAR